MTLWGKMEFVAIPIGHAGTTLQETHRRLTQALSATRLEIERQRARRDTQDPATDSSARIHDTTLFKSLMHALTQLAQTRLTCIIYNSQNLVRALYGEVRRTRAHSDATPAQGTHQQGVTINTHKPKMHAPRIPESTAIT